MSISILFFILFFREKLPCRKDSSSSFKKIFPREKFLKGPWAKCDPACILSYQQASIKQQLCKFFNMVLEIDMTSDENVLSLLTTKCSDVILLIAN